MTARSSQWVGTKAALDAARRALKAGLCPVPPTMNGEKRPYPRFWEEYQRHTPSDAEVERWYSNGLTGHGLVCGAVSGNLEVLDFDTHEIWRQFKAAAESTGLSDVLARVRAGYSEQSPNGQHLLYFCDEIQGNTKLASKVGTDKKSDPDKTLIETRGEGGYIITAPSVGVNREGAYVLESGGFDSIVRITPAERRALHALARTFDEAAPRKEHAAPSGARPSAGNRPGDDYVKRTTWREVLEPHGWNAVHERNGTTYWRRPGKEIGVSATTNHAGSDLFYPFSTSTVFNAERGYNRFSVYALLNHSGDFQAAAKALAAAGYGEGLFSHSSLNSQYGKNNSEGWPDPLGEAAYYGVVGEITRTIEPHTEADPVAILIQTLVAAGNAVGPTPHFEVEGDTHRLNLFAVLTGVSSKGRKGTSWGRSRHIITHVDTGWQARIKSGLSSGEGLIWEVRDPIEGMVKSKKNGEATFKMEVIDPGVTDKRLMVIESEFAKVLRVFERQGNTLSSVIRDAWDHGNLASMVKNNPANATGAHISILGHITNQELLRYLDTTEAANGLGNRFLWVCVQRSKLLPEGGNLDNRALQPFVEKIRRAFSAARRFGPITRDPEAREVWCENYPHLSRERPGLRGALLGRAEAQTMRLACLYAVLDSSQQIKRPHLEAALEVWRYVEQSVAYIFGDSLGDPVADTILRAVRRVDSGMTRTEVSALLGRHKPSTQIDRAVSLLMSEGLIRIVTVDTAGRPAEKYIAIRK